MNFSASADGGGMAPGRRGLGRWNEFCGGSGSSHTAVTLMGSDKE